MLYPRSAPCGHAGKRRIPGAAQLRRTGTRRAPQPRPHRTFRRHQAAHRETLALTSAKNRCASFGICKIEGDTIKGTKNKPAAIRDAKILAEGEVITIENALISGRTTFKATGVHLKSVAITLPDDEHVSVKGTRVDVDASHVFNCKVDGNFNAGLSKEAAAKYRKQGCTKLRVTFDPSQPEMSQTFDL